MIGIVTVWLSAPDVPVRVSVALLTVTLDEAVRLKVCIAPGMRLNVEG